MKLFIAASVFFLFTSNFGFGQGKKHDTVNFGLLTLDEFPVKIDGGCSFFTYDSLSLNDYEYVLVADANLNCFAKINNEVIFFGNAGRIFNKNGYVHKFSYKDYSLKLDLKKGEKVQDFHQLKGTLELTAHGRTQQFRIQGVNQEAHVNKNWQTMP